MRLDLIRRWIISNHFRRSAFDILSVIVGRFNKEICVDVNPLSRDLSTYTSEV